MRKTNASCKFLVGLLLLVVALCCVLSACQTDFTVTFDTNYEGGGKITQPVTDGKLKLPRNISRDGYLFDDWYLDKDFNVKLTGAVKPKDGDVYYAKWIALPKSLSATFDGDLFVGDNFTKEDLTVTVTYSDDTTKVLQPSEFTVDLTDFTQDKGQKEALVIYAENSVEVQGTLRVDVKEVGPVSLAATYTGTKIFVGGSLEKTDIAVSGTYRDGSTQPIEQFEISGFDSETAGKKNVTVSCGSVYTTITIEVFEPKALELSAQYDGKVFVGDALDTSKLVVKITFDSGAQQTTSDYVLGEFSSEEAGVQTVAVTYGADDSILCEFTVEVAEPRPVSLSAEYDGKVAVGGSLDQSKFAVSVLYDSGATKPVEDFTVSGFSSQTAGNSNVTISCTVDGVDLSVRCVVAVAYAQLTGISATYNGSGVIVGDRLNISDITVTAHYDLLPSRTITEFWTEGFTSVEAGQKQVKVVYNENGVTKNDFITVNVIAPTLTEITARAKTAISLLIGEALDHSAVEVTARYNNGSEKPVTEFDDDLDSSVAGQKTVTISYTEGEVTKTAVISVQIIAMEIEYLNVSTDDTVPAVVNRELNHDHLVVVAHYTNGEERHLQSYDVTGFSVAAAGNITLTITCAEISAEVTVTIPVLCTEIGVGYNGAGVVSYGSELNRNSFAVTAFYNNGQTETLSNFQISGFDGRKTGAQTVAVTCEKDGVEKTSAFTVTVYAPLQSISAQYNGENIGVGGSLNNGDIEVTVTYSDGTSSVVLNFNVGAFSSAVAGTQVVEISYTEQNLVTLTYVTKSTTVNVVVVGSSVTSQGNFSAHFLELGNANTGDSVYIKAGDVDILIDAGSKRNSAPIIDNYIKNYCTDRKLEYVIVTHAHEDHIAGFAGTSSVPGIFERYECENIIQFARTDKSTVVYNDYFTKRDEEVAAGANLYTALDCYNNANGAQRVYDLTGDGSITMEILYQKYYENKSSDENNYSVCVMFHQGENHYLFTGDLEKDGESSLVDSNPNLPEVVLFKGGHHGSYTSTSDKLLAKIKPQYICVCCCAGNTEYTTNVERTFPAQDFIDRVAKYTDRVYVTTLGQIYNESTGTWVASGYTSMNGNIVFSCKNGVVSLNCYNNNTKLKDTAWFKANRNIPIYWQEGTSTPSMYHD